jgi:diguanylate cyclase (GGDEF)-like protein
MVPSSSGDDPVDLVALSGACVAAEAALESEGDDHLAVDRALEVLHRIIGPDLLVSVYVVELGRLWLVAQRGYDQVRDGFTLDQGVMARAARNGSAQVVVDGGSDPDFIPATSLLRSEIALPLGSGTPAVGVFNVETRNTSLDWAHVAPLESLAQAIADRLGQGLDPAGSDLSSLARLFVYASALRDRAAIAELAVRTVGRLFAANSSQLNLLDGDRFGAVESYWRPLASTALPLDGRVLDRLREWQRHVVTSLAVIDSREPSGEGIEPARSLVWLPLRAGGQDVGVLTVSSSELLAPTTEQSEAAMLVAAHVAALLDAAQALERERHAATHDALTGLLNRRGFLDRLERELAQAGPSPLSLLLVDCDNLKEINEHGGHALGDRALQEITACLRASCRPDDSVARLGGDEFAVLLPGLGPAQVGSVAERVRSACETSSRLPLRLTVSLGSAIYPTDSTHAAGLLDSADQALFAAKRTGKNRSAAYRTGADGAAATAARDDAWVLPESR